MYKVQENQIQNALIVYLEIESLDHHKLENSYDEFKSLVFSSGICISKEIKLKQNSPIISTFISKGKLELLKELNSEAKPKDAEAIRKPQISFIGDKGYKSQVF